MVPFFIHGLQEFVCARARVSTCARICMCVRACVRLSGLVRVRNVYIAKQLRLNES